MDETLQIVIVVIIICLVGVGYRYKNFRNYQKAQRQFVLTHVQEWLHRKRALERIYGDCALKAIEAVNPVLRAYGNLLRHARRKDFFFWVLGHPLDRLERIMDTLKDAAETFDQAYNDLLSKPLWQNNEDTEED